jgi:hypothetical protein
MSDYNPYRRAWRWKFIDEITEWDVPIILEYARAGNILTNDVIEGLEKIDPENLEEPYRTILASCQNTHNYDFGKTMEL